MMNMRQPILAAIAALLQGGEAIHDQVMEQLAVYKNHLDEQTILAFIWSGFFSMLSDSVFYTDTEFLHELRQELQGERRVPHRLYVFQNFVDEFADAEVILFGEMRRVLDFYERILAEGIPPGETIPSREIEHIEQYAATLRAFDEHTPLYQLLFSEIITACLSMELDNRAWQYYHHPIPIAPYTGGDRRAHRLPDVTNSIHWAKIYYSVLEGKAEGYITWYINPDSIVFALH